MPHCRLGRFANKGEQQELELVGATGFEPATPCTPSARAFGCLRVTSDLLQPHLRELVLIRK